MLQLWVHRLQQGGGGGSGKVSHQCDFGQLFVSVFVSVFVSAFVVCICIYVTGRVFHPSGQPIIIHTWVFCEGQKGGQELPTLLSLWRVGMRVSLKAPFPG